MKNKAVLGSALVLIGGIVLIKGTVKLAKASDQMSGEGETEIPQVPDFVMVGIVNIPIEASIGSLVTIAALIRNQGSPGSTTATLSIAAQEYKVDTGEVARDAEVTVEFKVSLNTIGDYLYTVTLDNGNYMSDTLKVKQSAWPGGQLSLARMVDKNNNWQEFNVGVPIYFEFVAWAPENNTYPLNLYIDGNLVGTTVGQNYAGPNDYHFYFQWTPDVPGTHTWQLEYLSGEIKVI